MTEEQAGRADESSRAFEQVLAERGAELAGAIQADLRHAVQLRSLSRVYMGVAHDLRAPLNAIRLNLELLKRSLVQDDGSGDPRPVRRLQWVHVIEEELARLARTLDAMLAQTAPGSPERGSFDLRDLLSEIQHLLAAQARQQRVKLTLSVPAQRVPVLGRRDAVKQAVINLAINALEAVPEAGALSLVLQQNGDMAVLTVSDTGPGVPGPIRERLFDPYTTTKAAGTGIGLFVARATAESEGGFLRLNATGPGGSVFELGLPIHGEGV